MLESLTKQYENTKLLSYYEKKFFELTKMPSVYYVELSPKQRLGVLIANFYYNGKLRQLYTPNDCHCLVVAGTGVGKTTQCFIPQVNSDIEQEKNIFAPDCKGEIKKSCEGKLKNKGYRDITINTRDLQESDCYNPMTDIYRSYHRAYNLEEEVEIVETEDGPRNRFQGVVYQDQRTLDRNIKKLRKIMLDDVERKISSFIRMISPPSGSPNDRIWEEGSRQGLLSLVYCLLEDSRAETSISENLITEETFNMSTLIDMFDSLGISEERKCEYLTKRNPDSKALQNARNNFLVYAPTTASSFMSVAATILAPFRDPAIRHITSCNSFEFDDLITDKPVALFIIYKDEEPESYSLISLFIQQLYVFLIGKANEMGGRLKRPWYFLLDEFAQLPPLYRFENVISACRGREIYFTLAIQSYAQLENVYGRNTAEIIKDNISVRIFLGSGNYDTLEAVSKECGKTTILSPLSALNGGDKDHIENYALETIPLVPISKLSSLQEGEAIISVLNSGYTFLSKLERYYKCKELLPIKTEGDIVSAPKVDPFDDKYTYTFKLKKKPTWR